MYFTFCTGIYLVQYESIEKNNSIWKGLFFEVELGDNFYFDITKNEYEKDYNLKSDYRCVHCNKLTSIKYAKQIDYKSLLKCERMLRVEDNLIDPSNNREEIIKIFENKYNQPIIVNHFDEKIFNERQENKGHGVFPMKIAVFRLFNT